LCGFSVIKSKMHGRAVHITRIDHPRNNAILVRMPFCDYMEGVERDGKFTFRFMKQVRIWTKVDNSSVSFPVTSWRY
jgi:hypothetical protein